MSEPHVHFQAFLSSLGFDGDPEMIDTATRFTRWMSEFVPSAKAPEVSRCAVVTPGPVAVRSLPFHSLCAHHLLPFFGHVAVAYRPGETLIGLGSLPRLVEHVARRPQTQERLADQLATVVDEAVAPQSVAVGVVARHLCMEMRGARVTAEVTSVAVRGTPDPWLLRQVESPRA